MKKTKRRALAAGAVIAAVAVALCAVQYVFCADRLPQDIRKLIAKYKTAPDIETAKELAEILIIGDVSDEVGSRVLKALMQPTLHTREAYPLGSCPIFAVSYPNRVMFSPAEFTWQAVLLDDDDPSGRYRNVGHELRKQFRPYWLDPRYEMTSPPYPLGRHDLDLRIEYSIKPRNWGTIWSWPNLRNFPHRLMPKKRTKLLRGFQDRRYQCTLELPVQLNIVPLGSETKVKIVSGTDLDSRMKAGFTSILRPVAGSSSFYRRDEDGSCVTNSTTGGVEIFYSSPTEHYAFKAVYRDGVTGVEYPLSFHRVILKGDSGKFIVHASSARLPKPGTYTGMIIFTPGLSRMSHYPEIAQAWGGRVSFPITFQWQKKLDPNSENDPGKAVFMINKIVAAKDPAGVAFLASKLDDRRVIGNSSTGDDVLVCDIAASALHTTLKINSRRLKPIYCVGRRKERDEGIAAWKEWWDANKDVPPDEWQRGE